MRPNDGRNSRPGQGWSRVKLSQKRLVYKNQTLLDFLQAINWQRNSLLLGLKKAMQTLMASQPTNPYKRSTHFWSISMLPVFRTSVSTEESNHVVKLSDMFQTLNHWFNY